MIVHIILLLIYSQAVANSVTYTYGITIFLAEATFSQNTWYTYNSMVHFLFKDT